MLTVLILLSVGLVFMFKPASAPPSVLPLTRREAAVKARQGTTTEMFTTSADQDVTVWLEYTTTFVETELQTVTETTSTLTTFLSGTTGSPDTGWVDYTTTFLETDLETVTETTSILTTIPIPATTTCYFCGFADQLLCCPPNTCYTDSNNQAQCGITPPPTPPPISCPTNSQFTTVYSTTRHYTCTVLTTYCITATLVNSGVETIIRTATFQAPIASCIPQAGQVPCGNVCCPAGQACQAPGVCTCAFPPTCDRRPGETICGDTCCEAGQYCAAYGLCVDVGSGGSVTCAPNARSSPSGCNSATGEILCGDICCEVDQYCSSDGQCVAVSSLGSSVASGTAAPG